MALTKINNNTLSAITGLPAGVGGKVLQVKYANGNTSQSLNSVSDTDITSLSIAITPASTSSKFLLTTSVHAKFTDNSGFGMSFVKTVGGSSSVIFSDASAKSMYINSSDTGIDLRGKLSFQYFDSPSTTSEITYKVQVDVDNNVTFQEASNQSTFSVMEVES